MLNIQHLTKIYGGKKAVDDLSLHIRPGEIYGFIGHNGAGKTTTLKSCCGILQFDSGDILVDGVSIRPDNPDLYEYMTGIQYLNFIADVFGVPAAERAERVRRYGDAFELTGDLAQPVSAYSHGMKQKLAILSALVHAPKLLLMDEPFVGLDPKASHQLKVLMRQFCDGGGAIFFSTHVLEVAELFHPRAGSGRKALRQGGHHPGRQADPGRHHGRSQGRRQFGRSVPRTGGQTKGLTVHIQSETEGCHHVDRPIEKAMAGDDGLPA